MNEGIFKDRKFLIVHFRVGKTDGVSLEIDAWKKILEEQGATVALCSGPISKGSDYIIENLEQQLNPDIYQIDEESFGGLKEFKSDDELRKAILKQQRILSEEFEKVILNFKPTNVIVSNIFAVGEGVHAAGALTKVLDRYKVPTAIVSHDFYWENDKYANPTSQFIQDQLFKYFPLKRDYVKNYCINKIGQKSLFEKKGIEAEILYDTFNYKQDEWKKKEPVTKYLESKGISKNALVVLQATRVVRRKNIEIAIDFVSKLIERKSELKGKLYDGRDFDPEKDPIVFVISGYVEKRDEKYLEMLMNYSAQCNVPAVYLGQDMHIKYELFDIYPYADLITYPSEYEGFGNQILEAVFAKKPVVLFEYPVYKTDIKDKDFDFISFGDQKLVTIDGLSKIPEERMNLVVSHAICRLKDPLEYGSCCSKNFNIAAQNFSYENTLDKFKYSFS